MFCTIGLESRGRMHLHWIPAAHFLKVHNRPVTAEADRAKDWSVDTHNLKKQKTKKLLVFHNGLLKVQLCL